MTEDRGQSFHELAAELRPGIDAALCAYTEFPGVSTGEAPACPAVLRDAVRYILLAPGKRLRPMLALLAARACGRSEQVAMPAACAVEMVHTYSLIHDDLPAMDDDDLRRGKPSCHKVYGEALAILAGDALLTLAFEVLAGKVRPPEAAARCCYALARAAGAAALVGGQVDDLAAEGKITEKIHLSDLEQLEAIHLRKTAAMLTVSAELGGMCAGASDEQLAALRRYGQCLGLAFQIKDDLLDVSGSEASLGKRVGKDSPHGKLTYPRLLGVEESQRRAARLAEQAREALAPFGPAATGLCELARFVVERDH
jgi:geranylgeranyl diphosphate synthase type II